MDIPSFVLDPKTMKKRVLYAVASVLDKEGVLSTSLGEKHHGRLCNYTPDGLLLKGFSEAAQEPICQPFSKGSFENLFFYNVAPPSLKKFKTDTQISKSRGSDWRQSGEESAMVFRSKAAYGSEGEMLRMEEDFSSFNQFKVNETKFGVTTNYLDELYTTPKVDEGELTREQVTRAERVKREILSKSKTDEVTEDNEEAAFSAVLGHGRFSNMKPKGETKQQRRQKEPERKEVKAAALVAGIESYVPETKSTTPLIEPPISVTAQSSKEQHTSGITRLSPHDWETELVT
jgi:hypothetical protein